MSGLPSYVAHAASLGELVQDIELRPRRWNEPVRAVQVGIEARARGKTPSEPQQRSDDHLQLRQIDGLRQKGIGACRLTLASIAQRNARGSRDDRNRAGRSTPTQRLDRLQPVNLGHNEI